jgi:hypothetical protein
MSIGKFADQHDNIALILCGLERGKVDLVI